MAAKRIKRDAELLTDSALITFTEWGEEEAIFAGRFVRNTARAAGGARKPGYVPI